MRRAIPHRLEHSAMTLKASLRRILLIGLVASPSAAFAAAWTQEAGHGQVITTAMLSRADQAFDGSRSLSSTSRYQKLDIQALMEYGVTDRLTLILAPGFQHIQIGTSASARTGDPYYVEAGARLGIANGSDWVLSGQTTLHWTANSGSTNALPVDNTGAFVDVRALFGHGFLFAHHPAFLDVQVAQRFRSGGTPDEVHADVTFGVRPDSRWLLMAQLFSVVSEGAGRPGIPSYDYFKFQPSAVYALTERWAMQVGGFTTYTGRNSIQENGLVLGGWYQF
jgi:hypothetical protein